MSSPERLRPTADGGFSLLEVVVAVLLMAFVLTALAPQVVGSVRADNRAKLASVAKSVLQGQLDAMRTLPFHVDPSAGDHVDLLDTYYRDLAAPRAVPVCGPTSAPAVPASSWTGFVPATGSTRCTYEAATGGFYRVVLPAGSAGVPVGFTLILDTQFVTAAVAAAIVVPPAGFNTQISGKDRAPAPQVRVTATVFYADHGNQHLITTATQIAQRVALTPQIKMAADATVVNVGSTASSGETLGLNAGQLDLAGSLSEASEASANLAAVAASGSVTGRQSGAALTAQSPYSNLLELDVPPGSLGTGCASSCWGTTALPPFVLASTNGLPRAGVQGLGALLGPVQTLMPDEVTNSGFSFSNGPGVLPGLSQTSVSMDPLSVPGELFTGLASGVFGCAFNAYSPVSHLGAAGYLNSTDDTNLANPDLVDACAGGRTDQIRILPTTFAPDGLVRITARGWTDCSVSGAGHVPTTSDDYLAEVEYWSWTPALTIAGITVLPGSGRYVSAGLITPTTVADPLAAVALSTPVSDTGTLGDYIASWSGLTAPGVQRSASGHVASLTLPALVTLQTQPLRGSADPASAVSVAVGASSCYAEDNR